MTKGKILVYKKPLHCQFCGADFDGFAQAPDEGFGYAAQLCECRDCHAVFSHSIGDAQYLGSPEDRIAGQTCPDCGAGLDDSLEKRNLIGACPNCGKRDFNGTDRAEEAYIEAYQLYR